MATDTTTRPPEADRVQGEVVDDEPPRENTRDQAARDAVDAIADLALQTPGLPGKDEFLVMAMTAKVLSMSPGVKKGFRGNPHLCLQAIMVGRELGIGPTTALEMIDPIPEGGGGDDASTTRSRSERAPAKGYRLSLSPRLLNARLSQLGLGRMKTLRHDCFGVELLCLDPRGEELDVVSFTWVDAQTAGAAGPDCHPSEDGTRIIHAGDKPWDGKGLKAPCGCKGTYRQYPTRMLRARATGHAADDVYPGSRLGLYSPDELGAMVDEEGRAIDPVGVDLPDGFELPPGPGAPGGPPPDPTFTPAEPAVIYGLFERIACLDDEGRAALRQRWDQGRLAGIALGDLMAGDVKLAGTLVNTVEQEAVKRGVDLEGRLAAHRAEHAPPPEDPPPTAAPAGDAPAGQEGAPEPAPVTAPAGEPDGEPVTATPPMPWDDLPADPPAAAPAVAEPPADPPAMASKTAADLLALPADVLAAFNAAPEEMRKETERYVKGLTTPQVDEQLMARSLSTKGPGPLRRSRLAVALVAEDLVSAGQPIGDRPPQPGGTLWAAPPAVES